MAGTVVLTSQRTEGVVKRAVITCTGDSADGTFPTTTLRALGLFIDGTLLAVETNPGATAPTANYDITLIDGDGLDRLNGEGANRHTSTSERSAITGAAHVSLDETLSLTIANNSVNSAVVVITFYWTAAASSPGSGVVAGPSDTTTAAAGMVVPGSATALALASAGYLFDGTNFVRERGNVDGTALSSAARTTTTSSVDLTNHNARGAMVFIDITAVASTPSTVFTITAKDPISGVYTALLTSAALVGIQHVVLMVYPGITAAANLAVSMFLPRVFRVTATHGNANSQTYSVGYSLIR